MPRALPAELFERAIEIAPAERAAWLDAECGGNQALRVAVERMLSIDAKAAAFLETPPLLAGEGADPAAPRAAPREFGAWRVLRSLGAGGMGEVWLAERCDSGFEQRGAVKQLAYPTPGLLQRFRQERQILARLEHANIARLIDGGVDADGAPYLVMEFVEGVPITVFVRDHALDLPARLRLFIAVCEAVQYAHQNLVVHRDLKPSNIFVTADGVPKLLDFGIAKVLATTGDEAATQTFARMLTPGYAAPEQFGGGPITTATDVYALGVVLYELLTEVRPRRAAAPGAAGDASVDPPAPSAAVDRAAGAVSRRALRGDLDRIVLSALAADPQRRYPSAATLAADLERYLDGRPISSRRASAGYRLRKFARRNRYALVAAFAVMVVSLAAAVISLNQAMRAKEQTARAEAERAFLVGVFERADPDQNKGHAITADALLEKGEQQLHAIDANQPDIRADLTTLIARLYWDIGNSAHAAKLLPLLKTAATDTRVPDPVRSRALSELARVEIDRRLLADAIAHARAALALAERAGPDGESEAVEARHRLAGALVEQNNPAAEPLLRRILADDVAAHGERSEEVAGDLQRLGTALDGLTRRDEALVIGKRQVALARDLHGELHSTVVNGLNSLAGIEVHQGDLIAAAKTYRQALDAERQMLGPEHASTRIIHSNLLGVMERQGQFADALRERREMLRTGKTASDAMRDDSIALVTQLIAFDYRELGQLDDAEAAAREALATWRRIESSADTVDSAPPLENLGVILYLQGRNAEAEVTLRQAIAIMHQHASPSSQWVARMRGELADTLRREHRYAEALREASQASAVLAAALSTSQEANPVLAVLEAQRSEAQLDAGDVAGAEQTGADALVLSRRALPANNYRLGAALFALARAKLARNRPDAAEALLREALYVRRPPHPAHDPRVLEVEAALADALAHQGKTDAARKLRGDLDARLDASKSPYATELRARLSRR